MGDAVGELVLDPGLSLTRVSGLPAVLGWASALEVLAAQCGQPGTMHGLPLLLGSRYARRKRPDLVLFHSGGTGSPVLVGAVLLLEYRVLGAGTSVFATADSFGVRTVVGPAHLHTSLCFLAGRSVLQAGGRLVLLTWRPVLAGNVPTTLEHADDTRHWHGLAQRSVQDTLPLASSAEATLQTLGKRTRVHLRADRRRFDTLYPAAELLDATEAMAVASDDSLQELNEGALDTLDQQEFNHQVRTLSRSAGGFVLGLRLDGRWISLVGGWRQGSATWIEWQCNRRGFAKLSLGSVLRTYLLEVEARRGSRSLSFHGGTSHSMLHRFQRTAVTDLLIRRQGLVSGLLVAAAPRLCRRFPALLRRGNFLLNALCTPGLHWTRTPDLSLHGSRLTPDLVP